ncbi:hypothetical protein [Glycomyces salinus]|uniref:hypothetical protein n=1 Tax=Glycomyces salinus TaxID=980294 RepID=UPI0018EC3212|nr:hypothetical protein [Glycomyces salinus]
MKKRLAAVALAFAAAMMVGVSAPTAAHAEVVESAPTVQQDDFWDWRYLGAYSSRAACDDAGGKFEFESLPAIVNTKCVKGNNDGRIVYKLYWRPFF